MRSKIQIEDLVDKSSNMLFPEQGMTTLSRHSAHYSERRRESRIQSIHSTQPTELSSNGKLQGKMECRLQYIGFSRHAIKHADYADSRRLTQTHADSRRLHNKTRRLIRRLTQTHADSRRLTQTHADSRRLHLTTRRLTQTHADFT